MFFEEIQRRSSEKDDFVKIFMKDLLEISFFRRSQKRFGSWAGPKILYLGVKL
jgi:hypothetical protein